MSELFISKDLIHLRNKRVSYLMHILPGGIPIHLYYGKRLEAMEPRSLLRHHAIPDDGTFSVQGCSLDHVPSEYPSFGLGDLRQGALTVRRGDGTASCDLRFVSAEIDTEKLPLKGLPSTHANGEQTLRLILKDELLGLTAVLRYSLFDDCDAIARSVELINDGQDTLSVERAMSLCLSLPTRSYDILTLAGAWSREREMFRRPMTMGECSVGSIKGASSLHTSPFVAMMTPETNEHLGEVYGFALVYSGNFYAGAQVDPHRTPQVMIGIHPDGFGWTLEPGESFQTPEAIAVYSDQGLNGMSAQFHTLCAKHVVRGKFADQPRPILLNNWEATYFNFNHERLVDLAKTAARVGVELFVLDDGWFGKRDDDTTSLGDWFVDTNKLPNGLTPLANDVHALGMKFGLWFEPEMISPKSKLYEAHPDWALHIDGRTPIEARNQLTLDLSREDVCEHVYHAVADILAANPIDYVKWDMNRHFSNIGSSSLPAHRQRELPHRYMLGLYSVLERLIADFPDVLFESCSSGGGRFDLGMLNYMPQTWCSDNTDAYSRCRIQYSTSLVFPSFAIGSHVSAVPNHQTGRITPLSTRGNIARSGCFGYELDLNSLTEEELAEISQQIKDVKAIRETLLYGRFYRLLSPYEGNDTAWLTVAQDGSEAVFTYERALAQSYTNPPVVRLCGLEADAAYRVEETGEIYGGDQLMYSGISVPLKWGDHSSASFLLRKI
ncbi:MAG: alpha-galactosidase [Clostridiales bacterium]|nr:alpha-galactosidase [Clostridiales bacterium]